MKILVIAGHGENDCGAVGNGCKEATLTRELANLLKAELSFYADVTLFDVNKNMYQYLKKNSFNFKSYNYVIELHFNAGGGKGCEVLVHPTEKGVSVEKAICENVTKLGFKNRGIKRRSDLQNMNICKKQGVSYALIETCFIDSKSDMALYTKNKKAVAKAISNGVISGFGLQNDFETAKKTVQTKAGLTDATMEYLLSYSSGKALINKLAKAMK